MAREGNLIREDLEDSVKNYYEVIVPVKKAIKDILVEFGKKDSNNDAKTLMDRMIALQGMILSDSFLTLKKLYGKEYCDFTFAQFMGILVMAVTNTEEETDKLVAKMAGTTPEALHNAFINYKKK